MGENMHDEYAFFFFLYRAFQVGMLSVISDLISMG